MSLTLLMIALLFGPVSATQSASPQQPTTSPPGVSSPAPRPEPGAGTVTRETMPEASPEAGPGAYAASPTPYQPASAATDRYRQPERQPDYRVNPYWEPRDWNYIENQGP